MAYKLHFEQCYYYDTSKAGIPLPITLQSGVHETHFEAYVDTGASFCIFERMFGEDLGIQIETGHQITLATATGRFTAFGHTVKLSVLGYELETMVYFAKDESFSRNVLGRNGWLNRLRIAVIDYEGQLYLSHYDED